MRSLHWKESKYVGLWVLALLTYGIGDLFTTTWAVTNVPGVIESNPLVAVLLDTYGLFGFLAIKTLVFLLLVLISIKGLRADSRWEAIWPPLVAVVVGVVLTGWNLFIIVG